MSARVIVGDVRTALAQVETGTVQCIATSPPYFGLRLYGEAGEEIGKERDLDSYVSSIVDVMRECRRTLRDDGVAWVNLGDSYASQPPGKCSGGSMAKSGLAGKGYARKTRDDLVVRERVLDVNTGNALLVPFRVALAPWVKIAAMPESVQSRPCVAHEYVLFLTKRTSGYFYDADAVRVSGALSSVERFGPDAPRIRPSVVSNQQRLKGENTCGVNPAGRSLRSSDFWRAGAREAGKALLAAADGEAVGILTNDDAPAAFVVNPKGSGIQHFAMWPARLVAPMLLAGTPAAGSCSACGAPWARVVESKTEAPSYRKGNAPIRAMAFATNGQGHANLDHSNLGMVRTVQTIGFRPSCDHDALARPAIVLDPFAGAGTTLAVAECLGREAIGCELYQKNAALYPERLAIIRREMERDGVATASAVKAPPAGASQLDLFAVA